MTCNDIYLLALDMMDEAEDDAYGNRVVTILRVLRGEMVRAVGFRETLPPLDNINCVYGLPDYVCESAAVYGLAAELLIEEFPAKAAYFNAKYADGLRKLGKCEWEELAVDGL